MRHNILYFILFTLFISSLPSLLSAKQLSYQINGKTYEGYFINKGAQAPLILLVHDWDGLTDYEIRRSQMLADLGYSVFAVDLFGAGIRPTQDKDKRQHTGELYKDRQKMRTLLLEALALAQKQGANRSKVVAMGYCFGGAAVLEFARAGADLRGFVSFHGGLGTPAGQDYSQAKGQVLVFHGTADANITMQDFAQLAQDLEKHKVHHEMISYGMAPHGFTVFDSPHYREDADQKSWQRFINFLQEITK